MKIFLIVLISLILIILIGYVYIHNKMIDAQEKSFKRLESADFKESPRHFTGFIALTEDSFWRLIDDSRAKNQESFDSQMDYLILQLSNMTDDEIIGFEKRLREKMIELWNYNIKSLYQILFGKYLSTDNFIYFRLWIISNGKGFFYKAINNTDGLSNQIGKSYKTDGEAFMSISDRAFILKHNSVKVDSLPRDLSNEIEYDFGLYKMTGKYILPKDFKKYFPQLTKNF